MTVFLTTHYMEEAAKANHIGIIEKGHMVEFGTPFSLKEQYAKDSLIIRYSPEQKGQLEQMVKESRFPSKLREEKLIVTIPKTISAIPLLNSIENLIEGFEVVQGTMDDVFLNVTKREREEQI